MSKFVSKEPVPVTVDGDPNTVYIKPKMDYGTLNRVRSIAASFTTGGSDAQQGVDIDLGAWNVALMTENIVKWEGPDFEGVACTPDNIETLDPDDPLVDAVLAEIQARNFTPDVGASSKGKSPNSPTRASKGRSKGSR